jgi:hypothetical protein
MQAFQQEVLRVVLLDTRLRRITAVMSQKAHSMNHSPILEKFFRRQSFIRPTLWSLCTIYEQLLIMQSIFGPALRRERLGSTRRVIAVTVG